MSYWSPTEIEFRTRRYRELATEWKKSPDHRDASEIQELRNSQLVEILPQLQAFLDGTLDVNNFRTALDHWSRKKPHFGFGGTAGAMFLNQLVKDSHPGEADVILRRTLRVPRNGIDDAKLQINEIAKFAADLRTRGSGAAVARAPFFTSWFWWIQDGVAFRPIWPTAEKVLVAMGWLSGNRDDGGERYEHYSALLELLPGEPIEIESVLAWIAEHDPVVGLDSTLQERCMRTKEILGSNSSESEGSNSEAMNHIAIASAEIGRIGRQLLPTISSTLGKVVKTRNSGTWSDSKESIIRDSVWTAWHTSTSKSQGIQYQLSITDDIVMLSVDSGLALAVDSAGSAQGQTQLEPTGLRYFVRDTSGGLRLTETSAENHDAIGVLLDFKDLISSDHVVGAIGEGTISLLRLLERNEFLVPQPSTDLSTLENLKREFLRATGYPSDRDLKMIQAGEEFKQLLCQWPISSTRWWPQKVPTPASVNYFFFDE